MYVFEFSTFIANIILSFCLHHSFHFANSVVLHQKHILSAFETVKRNTPSNLFYTAKEQLGCDWE